MDGDMNNNNSEMRRLINLVETTSAGSVAGAMGRVTEGGGRQLSCSNCGESAGKWKQWPNQDTGYGVCADCAERHAVGKWKHHRDPIGNLVFLYGRPNVHFDASKLPPEVVTKAKSVSLEDFRNAEYGEPAAKVSEAPRLINYRNMDPNDAAAHYASTLGNDEIPDEVFNEWTERYAISMDDAIFNSLKDVDCASIIKHYLPEIKKHGDLVGSEELEGIVGKNLDKKLYQAYLYRFLRDNVDADTKTAKVIVEYKRAMGRTIKEWETSEEIAKYFKEEISRHPGSYTITDILMYLADCAKTDREIAEIATYHIEHSDFGRYDPY